MARRAKTNYNRSKVKTANERLRKLETVSHLAHQSQAYRSIEKFANDPNSVDSKFYRSVTNKDGTPGIRFITPREYAELSDYEQKEFDKTLEQFLNNQTTTKLGVKKAQKDAYEKFMDNHPDLDWTQEEYENFWKKYYDYNKDQEEKERYNRLTQVLESPESFDIAEDLTDSKIDQIIHYTNREYRYSEAPAKSKLKTRRIRE